MAEVSTWKDKYRAQSKVRQAQEDLRKFEGVRGRSAADLRPGDHIVCREYVREGDSKRPRLLPRKVVAVWRVDDLIVYRTDSPHSARHVRTPRAPVRLLKGNV